jgi:hypothetical protein
VATVCRTTGRLLLVGDALEPDGLAVVEAGADCVRVGVVSAEPPEQAESADAVRTSVASGASTAVAEPGRRIDPVCVTARGRGEAGDTAAPTISVVMCAW